MYVSTYQNAQSVTNIFDIVSHACNDNELCHGRVRSFYSYSAKTSKGMQKDARTSCSDLLCNEHTLFYSTS